jgi:hypothetical protein
MAGMFYLIRVIFLLDNDMAKRFRLKFTRPAIQRMHPPEVRAVIEAGWNDETRTLDLRPAVGMKVGLRLLAESIQEMAWEYESGAFREFARIVSDVGDKVTIVDQIAWLDEDFKHRVYWVKRGETARQVVQAKKEAK